MLAQILKDWEVLVVDDEPDNLMLIRLILEFHQVHVTTAASGEAAWELMKTGRFQLGLLDIQMPKVSGFELVHWARTSIQPAIRNMKLIAVTAQAMAGDKQRIIAAGFDGYISKPIETDKFGQVIKEVLEVKPPQPDLAQAATVGSVQTSVTVTSPVQTTPVVPQESSAPVVAKDPPEERPSTPVAAKDQPEQISSAPVAAKDHLEEKPSTPVAAKDQPEQTGKHGPLASTDSGASSDHPVNTQPEAS